MRALVMVAVVSILAPLQGVAADDALVDKMGAHAFHCAQTKAADALQSSVQPDRVAEYIRIGCSVPLDLYHRSIVIRYDSGIQTPKSVTDKAKSSTAAIVEIVSEYYRLEYRFRHY